MNEQFIRDRITELRKKLGVSKRKMSYELGHSGGYISNITTGKTMPSMQEFLSICDYFDISPKDFFDSASGPPLYQRIQDDLKTLNDDDLQHILYIVNRLRKCQ